MESDKMTGIKQKLASMQYELLQVEFSKSGYNKFGDFYYHELEDILPIITKKCYEHEVLLSFDFNEENAIIYLSNWNDEETYKSSIPMPTLEKLNKKMNIVQSQGSYITYLKRYLLMNTFLITEESVIDSNKLSMISEKDKEFKPASNLKNDKLPSEKEVMQELNGIKEVPQNINENWCKEKMEDYTKELNENNEALTIKNYFNLIKADGVNPNDAPKLRKYIRSKLK